MPPTRREKYELRHKALKLERSTWDPTIKDIAEQVLPYGTVWTSSERNRGDRKDHKILNSYPVRALRTLCAGQVAGHTSPAREWFGLKVSENDVADHGAVKSYLDVCKRLIYASLSDSNWYRALSGHVYPHIDALGTAPMFMEEVGGGRIHFRPMLWGEYCLDVNELDKVDTCFRELTRTARQLVERFTYDKCPKQVRDAWDRGNYNNEFQVNHAVCPNDQYTGKLDDRAGVHHWASCWWMPIDESRDTFIDETGYEDFPVLAPRWSARPGDAYGRGPGWDARGDFRLLQFYERRRLEATDKLINPPMKASDGLKGASLLPGAVTFLPKGEDQVFEPVPDLRALEAAIERLGNTIGQIEQRVGEVFFNNLLQMLMNDERAQRPTATEVEAKRQETMLQQGPLLENLNNELLEPVIERDFAILQKNNLLPPPPPELEGQDIKIEFVSILQQMQQATGLVSVRTFMQEVQLLAQTHADVVDKVDADAVVDELARITGVRPDIVLSKEQVQQNRAARAQQEQAQQQGQAMLAATQGVKNLSGADPAKLQDLAGMLSPVAAAQGGADGLAGAA